MLYIGLAEGGAIYELVIREDTRVRTWHPGRRATGIETSKIAPPCTFKGYDQGTGGWTRVLDERQGQTYMMGKECC
jgi:hypothetical protein